MNILHTVQFYHPSVGGVQEVVRQVSEQLARRGHTITVATQTPWVYLHEPLIRYNNTPSVSIRRKGVSQFE